MYETNMPIYCLPDKAKPITSLRPNLCTECYHNYVGLLWGTTCLCAFSKTYPNRPEYVHAYFAKTCLNVPTLMTIIHSCILLAHTTGYTTGYLEHAPTIGPNIGLHIMY